MFDNANDIFTPSWDRTNAEQNSLTGQYCSRYSSSRPSDGGYNIDMDFDAMLRYMRGRQSRKSKAQ